MFTLHTAKGCGRDEFGGDGGSGAPAARNYHVGPLATMVSKWPSCPACRSVVKMDVRDAAPASENPANVICWNFDREVPYSALGVQMGSDVEGACNGSDDLCEVPFPDRVRSRPRFRDEDKTTFKGPRSVAYAFSTPFHAYRLSLIFTEYLFATGQQRLTQMTRYSFATSSHHLSVNNSSADGRSFGSSFKHLRMKASVSSISLSSCNTL